jgi:hypothetical protein
MTADTPLDIDNLYAGPVPDPADETPAESRSHDLPLMKPSAEERAERCVYDNPDTFHPHQLEAIAAIAEVAEDAYRDGIAAEQGRLLAMLREPSDELTDVVGKQS